MDKTCETCAHFHRHYGKDEDRYQTTFERKDQDTVTTLTLKVVSAFYPLYSGHCVTPRIKNRRPSDTACAYYEEAEQEVQV